MSIAVTTAHRSKLSCALLGLGLAETIPRTLLVLAFSMTDPAERIVVRTRVVARAVEGTRSVLGPAVSLAGDILPGRFGTRGIGVRFSIAATDRLDAAIARVSKGAALANQRTGFRQALAIVDGTVLIFRTLVLTNDARNVLQEIVGAVAARSSPPLNAHLLPPTGDAFIALVFVAHLYTSSVVACWRV